MRKRLRAAVGLFLTVAVAVVFAVAAWAAETHYGFNRSGSLAAGYRLGVAVESLDKAVKGLVDERDTMIQMRDGDGSQNAHYAAVTTAYGFSSDAEAKGAFLELDSLIAKLQTDSSVSGVKAAIAQFLARLRS